MLDELTTQYDANVDLGLWQNRLTLSTALYRRNTDVRLNYASPQRATISNRGLETTLAATWQAGKLSGTSSLAAAFNRNRYESPANGFQAFSAGSQPYFIVSSGQPVSSFNGPRYLGPDTSGNPQFASSTDQPLGSGLPRQLLSLGQTARYGHFSLQFQLDGMFGYQVFDSNLRLLDVYTGFNTTTRLRDRWTPTNTNTQVPRAGANYSALLRPTDYTLQSGNHVRLSALTLAANVWERGSRNVSVFVSGTNLLVITNYRGFDPNVSGGGADPKQAGLDQGYYPTARTVAVGVRATL